MKKALFYSTLFVMAVVALVGLAIATARLPSAPAIPFPTGVTADWPSPSAV
jgi:hypothetical protein